jgi:hypothetical protein
MPNLLKEQILSPLKEKDHSRLTLNILERVNIVILPQRRRCIRNTKRDLLGRDQD